MGKRQIIIPAKNIIENTAVLAGKEVNLLLKNNTVFHGVVVEIKELTVLLKDMLLNKHTFLIRQIEEIVTDQETLY